LSVRPGIFGLHEIVDLVVAQEENSQLRVDVVVDQFEVLVVDENGTRKSWKKPSARNSSWRC
jgi:hypothetical protein